MKKQSIGYKRLLAGFLFLLSPDFVIIDILPDFIGYLFIVSGLSCLADIDERAEDARALSKRLLFLSIVKFVFSMFIGQIQKTNLLLVTFSLAILDVILVLPFLKQFFHSLDYTATRQGVIISSKKTSEIRILMTFTFLLKDFLCFAPSLVSLVDPSETGNYTNNLWRIDFKSLFNILTLLSFFVMIILGLFMAVKTCMYFTSLCRNRELVEKLYSNFDKTVLQVPSRLISKNIRALSVIVAPAFLFFADFYIDFNEVLVTAVGFFLIFIYSLSLKHRMDIPTLPLSIVSAVAAVVGLCASVYRFYWFKKLGDAVEYSFSAQDYTLILGAVNFVFTVATLMLLWRSLEQIELKYLDERKPYRISLMTASGIILSVFNFILYVYPEKNASFVFPNIIFVVFFIYFSVDWVRNITSQILVKYKKRDFN